jgi:hypothetical protein
MKKLLAILTALITSGLGIAVVSSVPAVVEAGCKLN